MKTNFPSPGEGRAGAWVRQDVCSPARLLLQKGGGKCGGSLAQRVSQGEGFRLAVSSRLWYKTLPVSPLTARM
jgi:hypothetical protein